MKANDPYILINKREIKIKENKQKKRSGRKGKSSVERGHEVSLVTAITEKAKKTTVTVTIVFNTYSCYISTLLGKFFHWVLFCFCFILYDISV